MRPRYIASMALGFAGSIAVGVAFGTAVSEYNTNDREPGASAQAISASDGLAQVPDPQGRAPWAMRVYRADNTEQCYLVGQLRDGAVGDISTDGRFTAVPTEAGHCYAATKPRSLNVKLDTKVPQRRIILHGFVGSEVRHLALDSPSGSVIARPKGNGAVLLVAEGDGPMDARVTATFADGSDAVIIEPPPAPMPLPKPHVGPVDTDHK